MVINFSISFNVIFSLYNSIFKSNKEQSETGTLTLVPFILSFNSGNTLIIELLAPVVWGIILLNIERFVLDDLFNISIVNCVDVVAWIVVKLQSFII